MSDHGVVVSVNISAKKGVSKEPVSSARVTHDGLAGDAHAGKGHRQVSLLSRSSISGVGCDPQTLGPGAFAENVTVGNMDLSGLKGGERLRIGVTVLLEVTQIGKECHRGCAIRERVGDCVMPREGVFARVLNGGRIAPGDDVEIVGEGNGS